MLYVLLLGAGIHELIWWAVTSTQQHWHSSAAALRQNKTGCDRVLYVLLLGAGVHELLWWAVTSAQQHWYSSTVTSLSAI